MMCGKPAWCLRAAALIVCCALAAAGAPPARAQADVPADVLAEIESALREGEAAAANAALSAGIADVNAQADIVARTRRQVEGAALAEAVVQGISRYPGRADAIVRAAVERAPAYRDEIVYRAGLAFPAFADRIAAAAGVPPAPPPAAVTLPAAVPPAPAVEPARPAEPPRVAAAEAVEEPEEEGKGPPGKRRKARAAPRVVPELALVRTPTPPTIDGRLDEPAWRTAAVIPNLTQVEPEEGAAPNQPTEVRLLYDEDALYIAVRAFDSAPDEIVATEMERDAEFDFDDAVFFVLDTFHDRRSAFFFRVNPLGARGDGLIEKSRKVGDDWDGIWHAGASIDRHGWVAEIEIPYKTISFDPDITSWGFNIERIVRRDNEVSRWSAADQDSTLFDIADAGVLHNLVGREQGIGLDVKPSLTVRHLRNRPGVGDDTDVDPSFDAFYKMTPSLTAALTVNTDFAETEVDEREINLTRFELFFPEKRDFFLQDEGIFAFGNLDRNGRPFFSRRIGLDDEDEEVDIIAGGKVTGRVGRFNIGVLDVQTGDKTLPAGGGGKGKGKGGGGGDPTELESKNLFVGRLSMNVFEQSSIGVIVTNGSPRADEDNTLVGFDLNYRDTEMFGDQLFDGNLWVQRSFTDADGDEDEGEMAYGGDLTLGGDEIEVSASFAELQDDFNPALGFANRRGIRDYAVDGRYRFRFPRGGLLRFADTGVAARLITDDEDNRVETGELELTALSLENDPGDSIAFAYLIIHEDLDEEFEIFEGDAAEGKAPVVIPADSFTFDRFSVDLATAKSRFVSGNTKIVWGEFFSGERLQFRQKVDFRPSPHLNFGVEFEQNDIDLPEGDFTTQIVRGRVVVQFTPDVSWSTLTQWDNVTDNVGVNSRFRWIFAPGNELFLVYNQSFEEDEEGALETTAMEIASKLVWTFRF